jgi:hypothetical protein
VQKVAAERGGGHGGGTPRAEPDGAKRPSLPQEDHRRGRGSDGTAPARRWCVPTPSACGFARRWACGPTIAFSCAAGRRGEGDERGQDVVRANCVRLTQRPEIASSRRFNPPWLRHVDTPASRSGLRVSRTQVRDAPAASVARRGSGAV